MALHSAAMWRSIVIFSLLFVAVAGCGSSADPSSGEQANGPYLRCAPPGSDGVVESFKLGPLVIKRDGHDLDVRGIDRGVVVLGVLAGINEPDGPTLQNLSFFLDRFKAAEVQAILVAGGVGLAEKDTSGILEALAKAPVPVLISPGAQESFDVVRSRIAHARKGSPQLIDMTLVRRVRMGHISIISLPGYHNPYYLEAGERGCSYEPGDLADVAGLVEKDKTPVLLSASPPRGKGLAAVDRGRGGVNMGDPALARSLLESKIGFGLFGHVYEAGGKATNSDGETSVASGAWQDTLYLQAGAVDSVPLTLVDGGLSVGMAHVVEFSGSRGRYRTIMAAPSKL